MKQKQAADTLETLDPNYGDFTECEEGWQRGYHDFQDGYPSAYELRDDVGLVYVDGPGQWTKQEGLRREEYARAYIEGFCQAESDSHD